MGIAATSYRSKNKDSGFLVIAYCTSLVIGLMLWLLVGTAFAFQAGLTLFLGLYLLRSFYDYGKQRLWTQTAVELFVPGVLWILFGVGGLLSLGLGDPSSTYGIFVADSTIVLTAIYMMLGLITFRFASRWAYRARFGREERSGKSQNSVTHRRVLLLTLLLLLFDWAMRYQQINQGVYFTWLAAFSDYRDYLRTSLLYQAQQDIQFILFPLLVYLLVISRTRAPYFLLLSIHAILIFLRGDRGDILLAAAVTVLAFVIVYKKQLRIPWLLGGGLTLFLFLGIASPIISRARLEIRQDARVLLRNPSSVLYRYPTEYLVSAAQSDARASIGGAGPSSTLGRFGAYIEYAAAINQAMIDGRGGLRVTELGTALLVLVPRFVYPDKPSIDANDAVFAHFRIGTIGFDAAGSPLADIFSYLHLPGVVLLMAFVAIIFAFIVVHLEKSYGDVGRMIFLGMLPTILYPGGDFFVGYLAGLRNALILLIGIKLILHLGKVQRRHPSRVASKNQNSSKTSL